MIRRYLSSIHITVMVSVVNHLIILKKEAFLKFVDNNSQPNGRCVGSYSAQYFFLPQFTRIDPPRRGEKGFEEKEKSSLVEQFNRVQKQIGETTISGTTARKWLLGRIVQCGHYVHR